MIEHVDGGTRTGTLDASAPAVGWASGPLGAVQAADREIAQQTAVRARAVAEFAATRPATAGGGAHQPARRLTPHVRAGAASGVLERRSFAGEHGTTATGPTAVTTPPPY